MSIFKKENRLWILYQVCPQGFENGLRISNKGHILYNKWVSLIKAPKRFLNRF